MVLVMVIAHMSLIVLHVSKRNYVLIFNFKIVKNESLCTYDSTLGDGLLWKFDGKLKKKPKTFQVYYEL